MTTLVYDARPDVWLPLPDGPVAPDWALQVAQRMIEARREDPTSAPQFAAEFEHLLEERDADGELHQVAFVAEDPDASFIVRFVISPVDRSGSSDAMRQWDALVARGWAMDTIPTDDDRVMRRGLVIGERDGSSLVEVSMALLIRMPVGSLWDVIATATTPMMALLATAAPYIEELIASVRVQE